MAKHNYLNDLHLISEFVFYDDAPGLLGVRRGELTKWVKGRAKPSPEQITNLARIASKFRRRAGQIKRIEQAEAQRRGKREIHAQLRLLGMDNLKIPDNLPPFMRQYELGKLASPAFIYDFREMSPNDVMQFFRFMKTVLPSGYYFLTYEVKPGGTSAEGGKKFWNNETIKVSTTYRAFCVGSGDGNCLMTTDLEFYEDWARVNDTTAKRRVIECGISYPRPIKFTEEEMESDRMRGADPVTGLKYIWQD